jgi:site-specific recombinase XerD
VEDPSVTATIAVPSLASPLRRRTDWQGVLDAIELFILERRADKKQPSTIRYYRQQLGLFATWLVQQDVPGDGPEDVTKGLILAYRLHLQERGHTRLVGQPLQHTTLVASQRALRTFFAWAEEEGYVIDGRILKLRKTRVPQKDATVYTLAQLDAILAACASPTEELAIRLLIGTGVRISEAVGVCLRGPDGLPDLETDNLGGGCATLRVRWDAGAKGLKTRRTPVAVPLMKAIRRYELRERPHVAAPQLLITRRGLPYKTWGLDSVMDRLQERVGFHVHAHAFRHTWASVMVQSGWSLEHVRAFIGHTDYTTLHRYVRLATERDLGDLDRWAQFIPQPARARFGPTPTWQDWTAGVSLQR